MATDHSIIFFTDGLDVAELVKFAHRLEELEYDALLVPEFLGREPYTTASFLLARTTSLKIGGSRNTDR